MAVRSRKNKMLNAADFKGIKTLLQAGIKGVKVGEIMGRSATVVCNVRHTPNLKAYRKLVADSWDKRKAKYQVKRPSSKARTQLSVLLNIEALLKELISICK